MVGVLGESVILEGKLSSQTGLLSGKLSSQTGILEGQLSIPMAIFVEGNLVDSQNNQVVDSDGRQIVIAQKTYV